ncbi:MAG: sigma-70 family RNA polymerase sigma factor [Acidobacteriota bacterium]
MDVPAPEKAYREYRDLMMTIARRRFRIPPDHVLELVHDVMVSFLRCRNQIQNPQRWFVGAICNASRSWWTARDGEPHFGEMTDETRNLADPVGVMERRVAIGNLLATLSERHRDILDLHYLQGYTAREIAVRYNTTPKYVAKLIHQGLRRAAESRKPSDATIATSF